MITNNHYIELYIDGKQVELESQDSLNLRINSTLFNPTKVSTTQAEWSYSFKIPSTTNNNIILGFANNLSKMNKFHTRYDAQVYADGTLLFNGSLTIKKYSKGFYECNLVNVKVNSLSEIFGEDKMTDMKWMVDFDGADTINYVNQRLETDYYFPFVSYGVFQKKSYDDNGLENYTPKHTIDKYNKWWIESFYPSMKVMEMMKRCYEEKGYKVGGSVFQDPNLKDIYASVNLADGQFPMYNLGNPKMGKVSITYHWDNNKSVSTSNNFGSYSDNFRNSSGGWQQELKFPYEKVKPAINASNREAETEYNFSTVDVWDMLDSESNTAVTVTVNEPTYMYDPDEHLIVIPADGWYKIHMTASCSQSNLGGSFTADQWTTTFKDGDEFKRRECKIDVNWDRCPLEMQLVRNYDDNIELIKGPNNIEFKTGDPDKQTYDFGGTYQNKYEFISDFPHQYNKFRATKDNDLTIRSSSRLSETLSEYQGGAVPESGSGHRYGGMRGATLAGEAGALKNGSVLGYNTIPNDPNAVMPYDQAVSETFICGFTTLSNGKASVMRDGYSWAGNQSIKNEVFADVKGLELRSYEGTGTTAITSTDYCKNTYKDADAYCSAAGGGLMLSAYLKCCVYLHRNDILQLMAVQRDYDGQRYATSVDGSITITAMSSRTQESLRNDKYWGWNSVTEMPIKLNLFNFTNKETKVSDWIDYVRNAFNLEILEEGKNVDINTNKGVNKAVQYAVKLDDRVNSADIESEYINYPRDMSVKYKIDTDEYGYWLTVPQEYQNAEDWANYGDSGFTVIRLNDDAYETSEQNIQTQFSYTWYDTFTWKEVLADGTETWLETNISIPVIEKYDYMAEGYDYADSMRNDGYSLSQRFWYRQQVSNEYVHLSSWMREKVNFSLPRNSFNSFNLSYKDNELSILTEYFNIHPMLSSNYINVECYLNPIEYMNIKNGALVNIDSDLYYTSEISGYDPSGKNETKLKLIKKV